MASTISARTWARMVTAVWHPMKRNDDIVGAVEALLKDFLAACRSSSRPRLGRGPPAPAASFSPRCPNVYFLLCKV